MGVQGLLNTHSIPFTHTQCVQGVFNTHSKAFTCTQQHSGGIQYSLAGIHAHSTAFRGCSILTQMQSFSWSHHSESHSIMTQWQSCTLIGCSHSLNGVHAHSMGVQGLFPLTHCHSCTLTVFRGCSILTRRRSRALNHIQGLFNSHSNAIFFMVTPWWVAFNDVSMAVMHTHWVFTLTQWCSCALNGCSGAVHNHSLVFMRTQWVFRGCSHSIIGVHVHSQAFRRCSILTQRRSAYIFKYAKHTKTL